MPDPTGTSLDQLAARLVVHGSRFARYASRGPGERRSVVAVRVLANLQHEGPLRIGELTARERISQPAMTSAVNRLEEDGLVLRRADLDDARACVVELTDAGRAELEDFRGRAAERARPALERLSAEDLAVLDRAADLLEQLSDPRSTGTTTA
ncbi:MarR family winged helix-turn-helix transcriptional regulator [Cellulomonas soli]|uniref:Transcriptional regulator n=1 Tax=Cellulomonas soli TaxID=931535 RepID=A0A512PAQ9_9CELL|nr:MarR family transcriptional regulator [Cellulomonas soli]NYI57426.1 DNA-binding MarR family transcriptional regulator [Cellulomonas soli]GEP68293.1 transcriptional regulator [Cellulomonas soli]